MGRKAVWVGSGFHSWGLIEGRIVLLLVLMLIINNVVFGLLGEEYY